MSNWQNCCITNLVIHALACVKPLLPVGDDSIAIHVFLHGSQTKVSDLIWFLHAPQTKDTLPDSTYIQLIPNNWASLFWGHGTKNLVHHSVRQSVHRSLSIIKDICVGLPPPIAADVFSMFFFQHVRPGPTGIHANESSELKQKSLHGWSVVNPEFHDYMYKS